MAHDKPIRADGPLDLPKPPAAAEHERRLRHFAEASPHAMIEIDGAGIVRFANPALHRLLALPAGGAVGRPAAALCPDAQQRRRLQAWLRLALAGALPAAPFGFTLTAPGGRDVALRIDWRHTGEAGAAASMVAIVTELGSRVGDGAHGLSDAAIDNLGDGFALFDEADRLVHCNRTFRQFLMPAATALGQSLQAVLRAAVATGDRPDQQQAKELRAGRRHQRPWERELRRGRRWYQIRDCPLADGGSLLWVRDISTHKQQEGALRRAKDNAEQISRTKSKFLAAASHDLRQPLHAASLFQQLLENRLVDDSCLTLSGKLRDALNATEELLNKLLDVSKLDSGMVRAERRSVPLGELLQRCRQEHEMQAECKALELRVVNTSLHVESDPVLLESMLRNLVANALRYAGSGKVLIGCRRHGDSVRLEVCDNGWGIPEGEQEAIFEDFYQIPSPDRDRQHGRGLGLGLGIVRRLGVLLGHRISVRSTVGRGTVFCIEVPLAPPAALPEPPAEPAIENAAVSLSGATVALIEDDPTQLEGLKLLLEDWGCAVIAAQSAADALDRVKESHREIDLAIADFRLQHGGTGIRALDRLAAGLGQALPGIILTGDMDSQRLKQATASGYRLLHKPVEPSLLLQTVRELVRARRGLH